MGNSLTVAGLLADIVGVALSASLSSEPMREHCWNKLKQNGITAPRCYWPSVSKKPTT
jgi:hypothetical protein